MPFIQTMRWFGPHDPVSLMDIRQAGCTGVVTALHQIPVGDTWPVEAILERKARIEADNDRYTPLHWAVVESLPVHEDIKKGLPSREKYIEHYRQSLRNLAACGIQTVCYNFMPVLDWSRTDVRYEMPDGSLGLRFVWEDFAVFDLCILQRPGAEADYTSDVAEKAREKFAGMTAAERQRLTDTVLLGLPGSEEAFELSSFQEKLDAYREIGDAGLRENLYTFIRAVAPVAEEVGIRLCIHPDDPPKPLLGLPRVVSTEADLIQLTNAHYSIANGITFCTGSLGVRADNDLTSIIRRLGSRIHFVHLRSTKREENPLNFHEADHLEGDVDMVAVIRELSLEQIRRADAGEGETDLPMRPDHGHQMLDDLEKKTYPGYSAIGRLRGLAELRGVERAVWQTLRTVLVVVLGFWGTTARADDGYRLWLKYDLLPAANRTAYAPRLNRIVAFPGVPEAAVQELVAGIRGLTGKQPVVGGKEGMGAITLKINPSLVANDEGYSITSGSSGMILSARSSQGLIYASFAFLRALQTLQPLDGLSISSSPKVKYRLLNHWDNNNGTIERGYAGSSLWKWFDLPDVVDERYRDYARASASVGINGSVVNNVNASARFLTPEYLDKLAALAGVFRPYGIKVYLSVFFAAPKTLGKQQTSDPLNPEVRKWWAAKTDEIYARIPDFGGFLVKANSEGEPGPQDYGRTHADGANMLAEALGNHPGIVMWRSFVYKANSNGDRAKEGFEEFKPLDGTFHPKVLVQVKNGPIDFQPREPFHPLFGAMPRTPLMMEFQLTQEYLGFATHLAYLAPMFKECLDTPVAGAGTEVGRVVDGSLHGYRMTGMAGVANTGSDRNWTGHPFGQANWYAFGRLAWDWTLAADQIATEWIHMTLTHQPEAVSTIREIMMGSREAVVNYMTPLGLHHLMGHNLHYGPEPWLAKSARPDWTAVYYHRADSMGIGFNRSASGSNALGLYSPEIQAKWGENCPPEYLLWFHHVAWSQKMANGRTLWDELCYRYDAGVKSVARMQQQWNGVKKAVDPEVFTHVAGRLSIQLREARWWRDACVQYFQTFSRMPLPAGVEKPGHSLEETKTLTDVYQLR